MGQQLIARFPHNGELEYLIYAEKENVKIIDGRVFEEHGPLDTSDGTGNGYHGRCVNCGLALVTDLGYCSWENTSCIKKEEKIVTVKTNRKWTDDITKATQFDSLKGRSVQNELLIEQGWGKYNYILQDINK